MRAGNVKAQYQFASFEQSTHTYSASEQTVELLSVDVQCLAASVLCVPLHQRLNLDEALFDVTISYAPILGFCLSLFLCLVGCIALVNIYSNVVVVGFSNASSCPLST